MSKQIYCADCKEEVGELSKGTKIKKGVVYLCSTCNYRRLLKNTDKSGTPKNESNLGENLSTFNDIFGGIFNK